MSKIGRRKALAQIFIPAILGVLSHFVPVARGASPVTDQSDDSRLIELKVKRDAIQKQITEILDAKAAADPTYALARRLADNSEAFDKDAANRADKWVEDHASDDRTVAEKYSRLVDLITLRTLLRILLEPSGSDFIRGAVVPRSNLQIKLLASRILQEFPDIKQYEVATPADFLRTITTILPTRQKMLSDRIDAFAKGNDWPEEVVRSLVEMNEAVVRRQVYVLYDENNRPAEYSELRRSWVSVNKEIERMTQP